MGAINIETITDPSHSITAAEAYGSVFVNGDNDAVDLTLPSAVAGMAVFIVQGQGVSGAITIQPNTNDYLVVDGVRGSAATDYVSTGAAGDRICVVAVSADDWVVTTETGTWAEPE